MEIKPTIENGKETVKLYGKIIDITGLKSFTHFGQKYVVKRDEDTPVDEVEETPAPEADKKPKSNKKAKKEAR